MEHIVMELSGRVAKITINRPEVMNALNPLAKLELSQAFDEVENNDEIWLAVLTGAGDRAFSAGRDLKHTAAM
ncbi:MAG: enoyl-CoA hydratase-related protein, partial [Gammaproteobacteria bacterium]|nr:enoyl-CoA hydratase-related protein [Gammaproteobacteria bacterium]